MKDHPQIGLTVDFDNRAIDLDSENCDLCIRITFGGLTGLISQPLGVTRHGLSTSASYAKRNGLPKDIGELTDNPLLNDAGIIRLPDFIVANAVRAKKIVHILPEVGTGLVINVVYSSNRRPNKRMRALVEGKRPV